jgi:DNA polymerase-1
MKIICDIETEQLDNPQKVWVVVCKEVESGEVRRFHPEQDGYADLSSYFSGISTVIGHNWLGFDGPVLSRLGRIATPSVIDTLVVSRLLNYEIEGGHSLEAWGERLRFPKKPFKKFSEWSEEMDSYCVNDVELTFLLYQEMKKYIEAPEWQQALNLEHRISILCNTLSTNGFHFDIEKAKATLWLYQKELNILDNNLEEEFLPKPKLKREVTPKVTKHGTLSKTDFRWVSDGNLTAFSDGAPFSLFEWVPFSAASPKQIVERLNEAGWKPTDKTKGHLEALKDPDHPKLSHFQKYGWRVSEENLATLPEDAPRSAQSLVQRLTLASRISDLEEWIGCYDESSGRIHGNFMHIGSWTHRMSHNHPNMANIPSAIELTDESPALDRYKAPMNQVLRALWCVPEDCFLVGCDADSIQLRVLAHFINDEEFSYALTQGSKANGTDPHSVNQRALGSICRSRTDAKTFIYAFLMGAGSPRIANVLGCTRSEADKAKENFLQRYPGYAHLRNVQTPRDADRGYFVGVDGRKVNVRDKHRVIAGYLQNTEVVVMKTANLIWQDQLEAEGIPFKQVDFVHDEWQTECPRDRRLAEYIGEVQARAIVLAGEKLRLNCPMAGNFRVGRNWYQTH